MNPLEQFARRACDEPFFLGWVLDAYARAGGLDDAALVAALGCAEGDLAMIRLCRAPRQDGVGFRKDVGNICERFGLEFDRLACAIKRGSALARMQGSAGEGFLMAARDREDSEEPLP